MVSFSYFENKIEFQIQYLYFTINFVHSFCINSRKLKLNISVTFATDLEFGIEQNVCKLHFFKWVKGANSKKISNLTYFTL